MFHKGARAIGGDPAELFAQKIDDLLTQFCEVTQRRMEELRIKRAVIRSALQCSLIVVLDERTLWVAAQKTFSMPTTFF